MNTTAAAQHDSHPQAASTQPKDGNYPGTGKVTKINSDLGSVELDDALPYDEPWGWMQPTRHALGALLLEQGRIEEAEAVYRSDLGLDGKLSRACQHPDNLWSLHGLHECLVRRGEKAETALIKQRLDLAQARAEIPIKASCFCRRMDLAAA